MILVGLRSSNGTRTASSRLPAALSGGFCFPSPLASNNASKSSDRARFKLPQIVGGPSVTLRSMGIQAFIPYMGPLSLGIVLGYAAGYFVKKVGKMALFVVGGVFVLLQVLAAYGFIQINWVGIEKQAAPLLEKENLEQAQGVLMNVLTSNLPFTGTFLVGFPLGFKAG